MRDSGNWPPLFKDSAVRCCMRLHAGAHAVKRFVNFWMTFLAGGRQHSPSQGERKGPLLWFSASPILRFGSRFPVLGRHEGHVERAVKLRRYWLARGRIEVAVDDGGEYPVTAYQLSAGS
jgi:hypothetical protein